MRTSVAFGWVFAASGVRTTAEDLHSPKPRDPSTEIMPALGFLDPQGKVIIMEPEKEPLRVDGGLVWQSATMQCLPHTMY